MLLFQVKYIVTVPNRKSTNPEIEKSRNRFELNNMQIKITYNL